MNPRWVELAKDALLVQDASNLSGVVHAFSRVITEVRSLLESEGRLSTEAVNNHPICVLYASKIASLTDSESANKFSMSYNYACDTSKLYDL